MSWVIVCKGLGRNQYSIVDYLRANGYVASVDDIARAIERPVGRTRRTLFGLRHRGIVTAASEMIGAGTCPTSYPNEKALSQAEAELLAKSERRDSYLLRERYWLHEEVVW